MMLGCHGIVTFIVHLNSVSSLGELYAWGNFLSSLLSDEYPLVYVCMYVCM